MNDKLNKFKEVLREVFQMDQADLDFGIYRIMNQKRDEIDKFLDNDLLPQVKKLLDLNSTNDSKSVKEELERAVENAKSIGVDPNSVPKVHELQEKYSAHVETSSLENEVFSHLTNFFKRYYDNGDFISQRRYKKDVYAIPYEGEEVKLYWANYDQYYIKTTEYFTHYSFKLVGGKKVNFKVVGATTEQNNNRTSNAKERRFFIADENPVSIENGELNIRFHYDIKDAKQKDLNEAAYQKIKTIVPSLKGEALNGTDFINLFDRKPTPKNPDRTLIEKHISDYTARNTFDYFIHKDLGGFLRRELDFYIKNEVLYIDDINELDEKQFRKQVSAIKVIKQVGHKVIAFLEQLENFQKKLWLKKKFVVETNYCITLDRVPRELWNEIITNTAQVEEWKKLFAIDEIQGDLERQAFTESLTERFLEQNQLLVLDTAFFSEEFKSKLLKSINNLDEKTNGLLIHSENFQVLNLLIERYRETIQCIHIDPPYNTATSGFLYKNNYQHASWLSMMENRLTISSQLLGNTSSILCHIDENEYENLHSLMDNYSLQNAGTLVWDKRNPMNGGLGLAKQHEYVVWRTKQNGPIYMRNKTILEMLAKVAELINIEGSISENVKRQYAEWLNSNANLSGGEKAYRFVDNEGRIYRGVSLRAPEPRSDEKFHLPLIHPTTNLPCEVPPNGFSRTPETLSEMILRGEILFGNDETTQPQQKLYLTEDSRRQMPSLIQDAKKGKADVDPLGIEFPYCHPISLYEELISSVTHKRSEIIFDYFAGSATTGQAVINLNREDGGNRKYILVEMGEYFDTVTKPRIQKVVYSKDWKDGKPVSRAGISHCFKYLRLESYEDTLNNLEVSRSQAQQQTLDINERFREGYMLSYMLDVETEGSSSLLNIDKFDDPFNYYLNITRDSEIKPTKVDLVETFNYLIGLVVETIDELDGNKVVTGKNLAEEKILIIWRNLAQKDNDDLNAFFSRIRVNIHDSEFDRIYVNGDNFLENMKLEEDKWKVVLIEEEFKKRMFENMEG